MAPVLRRNCRPVRRGGFSNAYVVPLRSGEATAESSSYVPPTARTRRSDFERFSCAKDTGAYDSVQAIRRLAEVGYSCNA